jgi:hypothetical protein
MKTRKTKQPADKSQRERFIEAARELGCDEVEEAFDKALRKIASERPPASVRQRKAPIKRKQK